ncbi:hypothetical protein [Endozoicomonas sp. SESOKO1]|uniref:hypothetical protein n=1 Tax=Endozoicomonas sp. SESOKO1 TaxID=2828742 RepID=UPI00214905A5|nr:hypothetical protein [Endozoicomonas sp. SESOKO1]
MNVVSGSLAPFSNASFPVGDTVSRSADVKTFHSKSVNSIDSYLPLTAGDVGKAKILSEIVRDGGKTIHDRLLKKLNLNATGPLSDPADGFGRKRRSVDTGQQDAFGFNSVPVIIDPQRPLGPEDLIAVGDDSYMRIGGSQNLDSLKVKTRGNKEVVLRMTHQGNTTVSANNDVGVTPCFVPDRKWEGPDNPDLAKAMGVFHDQASNCGSNSKSYGELTIKVETGSRPAEGTLFSLDETVDSRLYKSARGYLSHLTADASVATYEALKTEGVAWEAESVPLIALKVMNHDGKNYLTLQAGAYYDMFNTGNKECMPSFEGAATSTTQAKCCDGVQDGKYLAVMPLPDGWFDIKYAVEKGEFSTSGKGINGKVRLWVNGDLKANNYCRSGNNNHLVFGGGDLRPKFGLFDVSADKLTAKFKNPSFNDHIPNKINSRADPYPQHISGQCDREPAPRKYDDKDPYGWLEHDFA